MKKLLIALIVLAIGSSLYAQPQIGKPAPDFTLKDSNGQTHTLKEHAGKVVVLEWINLDCPFVQKFYNSKTMQYHPRSRMARRLLLRTGKTR